MPLYSYACPLCGAVLDEYRDIEDRNWSVKCTECEGMMDRMFTSPNFGGDLPNTGWRQTVSGYDEGLDEYVIDASHRKEIMKRKNLVEAAPDPKMKSAREEMKYVRKHAKKREADKACKQISAEASKKRRNSMVKKKVQEGLSDL